MIPALHDGVGEFLGQAGTRDEQSRLVGVQVPLLVVVAGGTYGAVMAAFGGLAGERPWMVAFGAIKVPLLFSATLALAVPCFYVMNVLSGVGHDFRRVWRALLDFQLAVVLQLAALAPVTLLVNLTESDYRVAQGWSTLLFAVAAWNARLGFARAYAPLEGASRAHRTLRRVWILLYAFIGFQMGWDLRPFVGKPELAVTFFRDDIGNAYVEVPRVLWEAVRGLSP